jgi:hypothetical protein
MKKRITHYTYTKGLSYIPSVYIIDCAHINPRANKHASYGRRYGTSLMPILSPIVVMISTQNKHLSQYYDKYYNKSFPSVLGVPRFAGDMRLPYVVSSDFPNGLQHYSYYNLLAKRAGGARASAYRPVRCATVRPLVPRNTNYE